MRGRVDSNSGMSLVEVVIAIAILGILSTASLSFYLQGTEAALTHQRKELAITVANESMEIIQGWNVAGLLKNRKQADVTAQWAAPTDGAGVEYAVPWRAVTYPGWDASASPIGTPAIPLSRTVNRSGTDFTAQAFIGTCYKPHNSSTCGKVGGGSTPPATTPTNSTRMYRVVVVVHWTAGKSCASGCTYELATLIDTSGDVEWNTSG